MRRREFITFVGGVGAWLLAPHAATAQPSDRVRRIAMLSGFAATDPEAQARVAALQQGLKELGWTEGRNVSIEFRWGTGGGAQMPAFASELIELRSRCQRSTLSSTISARNLPCSAVMRPTVMGMRKRRGPALPGLKKSVPFFVSILGWCE